MEKMTMARGAAARAKVQLTMCPRDYVTRSTKLLCRMLATVSSVRSSLSIASIR